jgi:hypothetical protein
MAAFLDKYITPQRTKFVAAFISAFQLALLLAIATIWILSDIDQQEDGTTVALTWGLWRLPDFLLVVSSLAILVWLSDYTDRSLPGASVFALAGAVVVLDLVSLILFGLNYRDCKEQIELGAPTDPLCKITDFTDVSLYYIILSSALGGFNLAYGIIVGTMLLKLKNNTDRGVSQREKRNAPLLRPIIFGMRLLTYLTLSAAFIVVEVCVLTEESSIKHLFWAHILQIPIIVHATINPPSLRWKKIFTLIAGIGILAAGLGGLLCIVLYYAWNCQERDYSGVDTTPGTDFANLGECNIGYRGTIYMIVLHAFLTGIAVLRFVLYVILLKNPAVATSGTYQSSQNASGAMKNYEKGYRNLAFRGAVDKMTQEGGQTFLYMTSSLSGQQVKF